jgi:hypothetical protein
VLNDSGDIVADFGKDMAWTGESLYDTAGATAAALESATVDGAKDFASDVVGLHPIDAIEDLGGIAWNDAGDLIEGAGMMGGEALIGVGSGVIAAVNDVYSVGADIVDDIGDGIKDVVGTGVVNDLEDAGTAVENAGSTVINALSDAGGALGNFEENLPDYIETGVVDGAEAVGEGVADAAEAVGNEVEDIAGDIADIF